MLFKAISASVYGIDAYLDQVEVDVGTGRMEDFNVVGLLDNAVKESRQRVKSALRNCGFEFPYGQGVTINLAPADLRKEGSAFDLPIALSLAGCQGQFFDKALDGMMFLGELSLDGTVRPIRGALSAALAARDNGIQTIAVPETNAKEGAVVDGIKVFALKSLPQAVDLINSPESFTSVTVDAEHMRAMVTLPSSSGWRMTSRRHLRHFPVALHARRHESVSLRFLRRSHAWMPVHSAHDPALRHQDFRTASRSHRYPYRSSVREIHRAACSHFLRKL